MGHRTGLRFIQRIASISSILPSIGSFSCRPKSSKPLRLSSRASQPRKQRVTRRLVMKTRREMMEEMTGEKMKKKLMGKKKESRREIVDLQGSERRKSRRAQIRRKRLKANGAREEPQAALLPRAKDVKQHTLVLVSPMHVCERMAEAKLLHRLGVGGPSSLVGLRAKRRATPF